MLQRSQRPAPPPLPPRARVAAALGVAAVVIVAARAERSSRRASGSRRTRPRSRRASARRTAPGGSAAAARTPCATEPCFAEQRLEMMSGDDLQVQPGRIGRERPAAVVRLQVLRADHDQAGHQPGQAVGEHLILLEPDGRAGRGSMQRQLADQHRPFDEAARCNLPAGIVLPREPSRRARSPTRFRPPRRRSPTSRRAAPFRRMVPAIPDEIVRRRPCTRPYACRVGPVERRLDDVRIAERLKRRAGARFVVHHVVAAIDAVQAQSRPLVAGSIAKRGPHIADEAALRRPPRARRETVVVNRVVCASSA